MSTKSGVLTSYRFWLICWCFQRIWVVLAMEPLNESVANLQIYSFFWSYWSRLLIFAFYKHFIKYHLTNFFSVVVCFLRTERGVGVGGLALYK